VKRRFVPVPYDAFAQCVNERERSCVTALFERAHTYAWKPLRMSVREFAAPGELRLEAATRLLEDLEREGLIKRERRVGSDRSASGRVEVFDPTVDRESPSSAEHGTPSPAEHETEHGRSSSNAGSPRAAEHGTEHGTPSPAEHPACAEDTRAQNQTRPEQEQHQRENARATPPPPTVTDPPAARGTLDEQLVLAAGLAAMQATMETPPIRLDPSHRTRLSAAHRQRGLTAEAASALWFYVQQSGEDEPVFLRARGHTGWSTLLNDRMPERVERALAWERRGRVDLVVPGPPARAAPRRREPTFAEEMAAAIDEKFSRFTTIVPEERWLPAKE
jgi:hypothetical protein